MKFLLIFISVILFAKEYSIQIISAKKLYPVLKIYKKFKNYPYVRVERIDNYYTLRIYKANSVKKLKISLKQIKKAYKSAFIRNIKWIESRIIYPKKIKRIKNLKNIFSLIPEKKYKRQITKFKKREKNISMPPYAKLTLDLYKEDKPKINTLLNKYNEKLPIRDKLDALIRLKKINKAKKVSFENMKKASSDYLTFKQVRDFYMEYANSFNINTSYSKSNNLIVKNLNLSLKQYFAKGYYIYIKNDFYDTDQNIDIFNIGLKKLLNNGFLYLESGYTQKNYNYLNFLIKHSFNIDDYTINDMTLGLNQKADVTTDVFLYGKRDYLKDEINYYWNNKNIFYASVLLNRFYLNNNYIGNSKNLNLRWTHKLRISYPDFSYYIFSNAAFFTSNPNLVKNYFEVGTGYFFGLEQIDWYTKILRPFLDVSLGFNSNIGLMYNLYFGIGGRLYRQDNISFGCRYNKDVQGNKYLQTQIQYWLWF